MAGTTEKILADIEISKEHTGERHGRYVARIEGIDGEAEITFTKRSADHTGAPETMRGTGAAAALVSSMIEPSRMCGALVVRNVVPFGSVLICEEWRLKAIFRPGGCRLNWRE